MVKHLVSALSIALFFGVRSAHADEPPPPPPALHHAPIISAHVSDEVTIDARIERADRMKRAVVVFHAPGASGEVELLRSSQSPLGYVAVIPATAVHGDLSYAIELETTSGETLPVFATRAAPQHITVLDSPENYREASLLARVKGRRSVVSTSGEYASFGKERATFANGPRSVNDQFYRVEGDYTYRLLGTVSEFGLRIGMVRGQSLIPGEADASKYDVGLNYGAPHVRLRLEDWLHLQGELLTSVTEIGFSVGGGAAVLLGDPYGSKLTLGFEGVQVFGVRGYSRLDLVASSRLIVSPIIEITTMPHADVAGVRLLGEFAIDLGGGFGLMLRGGYQARTFDQGGPTGGGGLAYAF